MVKALFSGSVSLVNKLPEATTSSEILTASFTTIGGSLTGVTVIAKLAVALPPFGSETVYIITGRFP